MLCHLIEEVVPTEYYTTMISLTADISILLILLKVRQPKLLKHFKKHNFELPMVLVEMFITVFCSHVSQLTDIFIDFILLEGSVVYFKIILLFFKYFEKELLKKTEFCTI